MIYSFKNKNEFYLSAGTFVLSLVIHLLLVFITLYTYRISRSENFYGGIVEIGTVKGASSPEQRENQPPLIPENFEGKNSEGTPQAKNNNADKISSETSGYANIESTEVDTSLIPQIYYEPTLNVRMKYPSGWVFIDQQRKNKLDGITFWLSSTIYNPPPYIHVEVVEKYMFNPQKYKHQFESKNFTGYYNDPEEIENQITQLIYLKTEEDEDFTIKLIMNNPKDFKSFQPIFFAIIKSFRFGDSFF